MARKKLNEAVKQKLESLNCQKILRVSNQPLAIINELKRGVTIWQVKGGDYREERTLLYLTVLRSRVYDVKFIINRIDSDVFMVVGVAQQA